MSADKIIPVLVYRDIEAAQAFLVKAFGFRAGRIDRDGQGNVVHGEVHHGDDVIWMHRVGGGISAHPQSSAYSGIVVHVADVDAHCRQARAAGAGVSRDPQDQSYGQREYEARDPDGHRWWFATPKR